MTRSTQVREARPDDLPVLATMWGELRGHADRVSPVAPTPLGAGTVERLTDAIADATSRVVVAEEGTTVVGMAVFSVQPLGPLQPRSCVHVSCVHVDDRHRRRGIGRALVGAAANFAEEADADHIVVSVFPHLREANRFYARLGFGPLVVRRVTSVAALRRRLASDPPAGAFGDMLARRRVLRKRSRVRSAAAARAAANRA